jgi:hypothetical protein
LFLVNFTFLIHSYSTFKLLEEVALSEKSWIETYKIGFLKLENSLNKLFLNQREFLAAEVRRATDIERENLAATHKELESALSLLTMNSKENSPDLNSDIAELGLKLKLWAELQEEFDTWVKTGDPDTALALFLDKGVANRSELMKPFNSLKEKITALVETKQKESIQKRSELKHKTLSIIAIGLALNIIILMGLVKLETLLTKFSDYLRRWIFASRATDNIEDLNKSLDSLHRNLLTLRSRLWGLKGHERIPQNPYHHEISEHEKKVS